MWKWQEEKKTDTQNVCACDFMRVCVSVPAPDSHFTPTVWMLDCSQALQYNSAVPLCQLPCRSPVQPGTPPFLLASIYGHPVPPRCSKGLLCLRLHCSSDPVTARREIVHAISTLISVTGNLLQDFISKGCVCISPCVCVCVYVGGKI